MEDKTNVLCRTTEQSVISTSNAISKELNSNIENINNGFLSLVLESIKKGVKTIDVSCFGGYLSNNLMNKLLKPHKIRIVSFSNGHNFMQHDGTEIITSITIQFF